jgi:hypothetical protein
MRLRTLLMLFTAGLFLLVAAGRIHAQGFPAMDPNDPDVQELIQTSMQMVQRMQEAGIDLQAVAEQVQSGSFDPESFQQMLVDKGVIDGPMMERLEKTGQRMVSKILKGLLNSTDEEWAILSPKIEKVIAATTVTQRQGSGQFGMGNVRNISSVQKAMDALKAELKTDGSTDSKIAIKLKEWREAFAKANAELKEARDNLRGVLTVRQEAVLVNFGLLD